ncbi:TetR family transcriptional regulator [Actinopolymorpha rutila]|uniref:AcrR family transcriptional regulator n=1 Tax=Actinopolymorpha rutila TaxID=446787 RepID=A0A852ZME0_9ACTN|nr:AcrR family transcriptional regulator [Actinopolymorpha rutila]
MTSTRGPRRRLSEDTRRGQIVQATVEVVAERGYGNASLAAIAEQAGVSKGLVSHYFTDRDTLMEHTARATLVELRTAIADGLDLSAPVPEIFRTAIHQVAHLRSTHAPQLDAIEQIVRNLRDPDGTPRLGVDAYEETYQGQEQLFRRGQREGSLRDFDTRVMAVTYQSAVDAMLGQLAGNPDADPDQYADSLTDVILAAIRA